MNNWYEVGVGGRDCMTGNGGGNIIKCINGVFYGG